MSKAKFRSHWVRRHKEFQNQFPHQLNPAFINSSLSKSSSRSHVLFTHFRKVGKVIKKIIFSRCGRTFSPFEINLHSFSMWENKNIDSKRENLNLYGGDAFTVNLIKKFIEWGWHTGLLPPLYRPLICSFNCNCNY